MRILAGYARGTRYGIRADDDGLLAAGRARRPAHLDGRQGRRLGRHAAHRQAGRGAGALAERAPHRAARDPSAGAPSRRAEASRSRRASGTSGRRRCTTSSTSITAPAPSTRRSVRTRSSPSAGLPVPAPRGRRAPGASSTRSRRACWTPLGLRSLAPGEPGYAPRYEGGVARARRRVPPGHRVAVADRAPSSRPGCASAAERRSAGARRARASSRRCCAHLDDAGLGHVSEIADGDAPHTPRGCPVPGLVGRRSAASDTSPRLTASNSRRPEADASKT